MRHVWHPAMQMADFEAHPPLPLRAAHGATWVLEDGRTLVDGISSWWCRVLGHQHPAIIEAIEQQLHAFEHGILANITYEGIERLSATLARLTGLPYVQWASDGSSAVEIALKLSRHVHLKKDQPKRLRFVRLKQAYHGETGLALSVSDIGCYQVPYQALLYPHVDTIDPNLPLSPQLEALDAELVAAVIVEPLWRGAGGMLPYDKAVLKDLRIWTQRVGCHLIADEIMTGIWRLGTFSACEQAGVLPDLMCLSKGLTGGAVPMSVTLASEDIYQAFYGGGYGDAFLHSHTYAGHALGVAAANAVLEILEAPSMQEKIQKRMAWMYALWEDSLVAPGFVKHTRHRGGVIAGDLTMSVPRVGFELMQHAIKAGAFVRPIGEVLYWMPPLNISEDELEQLARASAMSCAVLSVL